MNLLSSSLFRVATLAFAIPILGISSTVTIDAGTVSFGQSVASSSSTGVTVNGDPFTVASSYTASYGAGGSFISFYPTVTYTGAATLANTDTITIDYTAAIFDDSPGTFDGAYTETIPLEVPANATASGQLFVDGQALPLVGPFGPGSYSVSNTKSLTGLTGDTLSYLYSFTFVFAPGTVPGASASSPTPEPAQMIPAALSLAGFALVAIRRRKQSVV